MASEEFSKSIQNAVDIIRKNGSMTILSGAGVSVDSNIPTFRGKDGIWAKYPPELFGSRLGMAFTLAFFPSWFRSFIISSMGTFAQAAPNPIHESLAKMEEEGWVDGIITQNVDQLHQEAGSQKVVEVHGNFFQSACRKCKGVESLSKEYFQDFVDQVKDKKFGRIKMVQQLRKRFFVCPSCGGKRGPNMIMFGQSLDPLVWEQAETLATANKVMLILGTSGTVYPVADLPFIAREEGVSLIEINPEPSALTPFVDVYIPGGAKVAITELHRQLQH